MYKSYKLIVIGAGSGGLTAAELAAKFGAKVALIESSKRLGGECLHSGCVPSKALIHAARIAGSAKKNDAIGIHTNRTASFPSIKAHIQASIDTIEHDHDSDEYYQSLGVDVIHGVAAFIDKNTIDVEGQRLKADKIIVSTGSRPRIPNIQGISDGPFLTNETIFSLDELPKSLIVIGGGPIGCELGQAFAQLGSKVTILQSAPRLLPRDDPDGAEIVMESLKSTGVTVRTDCRIDKVVYSDDSVSVYTQLDAIRAEKVLIAAGRTATIPEGIEKAGVAVNEKGIVVNATLRTTCRNIYAIGDCNGIIQLTHTAAEQASSAVQNALYFQRNKFRLDTVSWTTFTTPEVAQYGNIFTPEVLKKKGYTLHRFDYSQIDRAVTENAQGFGKIVVDKKGAIHAATIVGEHGGELLSQLKTAGTIKKIATTTQPYPTYASGLWQIGSSIYITQIRKRGLGKLLAFLSR